MDVSKEVVHNWLREKKATYVPIPAQLNRNKEDVRPEAGICRHRATVLVFSEAGMLLTKQRRRMLPKIMKKLVYIRYEKKYRKWIDRLGISVSEEELKKGLEEEDVAELDEDMIE